jgi:predicted nucleic acid-binding protein
MGKARTQTTLVLDAGALIAFERADARMRALLREAIESGIRIVVPAGVVGQVWRDSARQVPLRALLHGPTTTVTPLDRALAEAAGILCGRTGTSDVIDAAVVLTGRRERGVVITSDVGDLRRLDRTLRLQPV